MDTFLKDKIHKILDLPAPQVRLLCARYPSVGLKLAAQLSGYGQNSARTEFTGIFNALAVASWSRCLAEYGSAIAVIKEDSGDPTPIRVPLQRPYAFTVYKTFEIYARHENTDNGWKTSTIKQLWGAKHIIHPHVQAELEQFIIEWKAELARSGRTSYNSTVASIASIQDTADRQAELTIQYDPIQYEPLATLKYYLDRQLQGHRRTVRETFIDYNLRFPCGIAPNLYLRTESGKGPLLVGVRSSKNAWYPGRWSHATAGFIAVEHDAAQKPDAESDLDENGVPDLFRAAVRECEEETGCLIQPEDIVFNALTLQPQTGAYNIYGVVDVPEDWHTIQNRPKITDELVEFHPLSMEDIEATLRWLADQHAKWMQDDLLGLLIVLRYITKKPDIIDRYLKYRQNSPSTS